MIYIIVILIHNITFCIGIYRGVRVGPKLGQIGQKGDKPEIFLRSVFSTFWVADSGVPDFDGSQNKSVLRRE